MRLTPEQVHLYTSKGEYIATQPYRLEDWLTNPVQYYDKYVPGMIATNFSFDYPILAEDGKSIREMTVFEQLSSGKRTLQQGESYNAATEAIEYTPCPKYILKGTWDFDKLEWKESATQEELKDYLGNKVYGWRDAKWEKGFEFTMADGTKHWQLLRTKDRNQITETKAFLELCEATTGSSEMEVEWQFSETDIVKVNVSDLQRLFVMAGFYVQAGYKMMSNWRAKETVDLTVDTQEAFEADIDTLFAQFVEAATQKTR